MNASSDAVQQGEVSSSKPTILAQSVFGPLLLEVRLIILNLLQYVICFAFPSFSPQRQVYKQEMMCIFYN